VLSPIDADPISLSGGIFSSNFPPFLPFAARRILLSLRWARSPGTFHVPWVWERTEPETIPDLELHATAIR